MDASSTPANRLDPRATSVWRIQALVAGLPALIGAGVLAAVMLVVLGLPTWLSVLPLGAVALWLVLTLTVVPAYRYRRWRWEVTTDEIRLQRGVIVIERTVIPMVRVQHVDTSQGPIIGAFGLSEVRVSTAAGTHAIPALADAHAAELRDRIAQLARVSDDGGL
jgi:membrane protein YdbS with pleckstrin-like domain